MVMDQPEHISEHRTTTAVTRKWSDINAAKLLGTFGCSSFLYSFLGNPLFLAVARQQCMREHVSVLSVLKNMRKENGVRSWFQGSGVAITGTVLSEMVYYFIIEFAKEKLPLDTEAARNFGAGLFADGVSGPLWTPFAVVSQMQWVAGAGLSADKAKMNCAATVNDVVQREGIRGLFKGTLMSWSMLPLSGLWWVVYEVLKKKCYLKLEESHASGSYKWIPPTLRNHAPDCLCSTTDNPLANAVVGSAASIIISAIMNPLWVIRTRLQVLPAKAGVRIPALWIARDLIQHEGVQGLFKGIRTNVVLGAAGGFAFGPTYEGTKKFADVTED